MTQESNVNMSGVPGMGEMTVTTVIGQTLKMTADDVAADGTATVKTTFEAVKLTMGTPMGKFTYDSAAPAAPNDPMIDAIAKAMGALVGESITIVTTPNGGVTKVSGMTEIGEKTHESHAASRGGGHERARHADERDVMTSQFKQGFSLLPNGPVKTGANWKSELTIANPMAPMTAATSYTLTAVEATGGARWRTSRSRPSSSRPGRPNPTPRCR